MFSIEVFSLVLTIIINLVILWALAWQSWSVKINRYFIVGIGFVVLWAAGTLLMIVGTVEEVVATGRLLFLIAPMYLILLLSLFASVFPRQHGRVFSPANIFLVVLTIAFSLAIAFNPTLLIPTLSLHAGYNDFTVDTFWYTLYTLYFNIAFVITFTEFILHIRQSRGVQHQQLLYVFTGTLLAAVFSLVTNLSLPLLGVHHYVWLGPTWTLFYVITVSISIVKHQLFDIKLAAVRSIAYICVLLTLSLIYYAFAYFISVVIIGTQTTMAISVSPVNIFMALVLAFLFQPVKKFFDQITDNIFYRSNYRSEDFFTDFGILLTSTIDLRGLLQRASEQIADTFKAEQALFFLYYSNETDHHMSAGTHEHARLPLHDARLLDDYVAAAHRSIFMTDFLDDEATPVRRMLRSHRIAVVMPLLQGERIVGYVILGDHRSGNYTKRDLTVLSTVSNELVIAIQNALSLHEVKELNATLQQRINVATKELRSSNAQLKHLDEVKDEFMSMASHQLRTPLTSIKGYLSMVLEGDAGKISSQQHRVLLEAFNSSERMVRLIADFLNVSRLQTGKFVIEKALFDMNKIVGDEVRILDLIARTHDVRLRFNAAKEQLPVMADEQKIRQVVMNFIDNAIYYSNPKGTIVINLERVKDEVALTVVDTGIGVPEEEQARLFTKFFRAGNARKQRPDGTGVGLYLARRVINGHGGAIIFSSKEGRGSTFGFRLPLAKVAAPVAKPKPGAAKLVATK